MGQLELLRDALLVSLVAILVFILYKRLLHLMGSQNIQAKYPALDATTNVGNGEVSICMHLGQAMAVKVSVLNDEKKLVEVIQDGHSESGKHCFGFNTTGHPTGKYSFEIITPHEKSIRYFQVS